MLDIVRVPHRASILEEQSDSRLVHGANLQGPLEQSQGPACFVGYSVDVGLPSGI